MTTCACGAVQFEIAHDRLILTAEDTVAIATVMNDGRQVKVEHLTCQSCMRQSALVGEPLVGQ